MSLCCNTPHLTRIEKIKENRSSAGTQNQSAKASYVKAQNQGAVPSPNASLKSTMPAGSADTLQNSVPNVAQPTPTPSQPGEFVMNGTFPMLPRDEMTNLVTPIYTPTGSGEEHSENNQTGTTVTPVNVFFPDAPLFEVPENPLLPPGYQETLDYTSLQYINGFYRTQIGRYVRVDYQTTSNNMESLSGYLVGVGINYILLQDSITSNIMALDSYSIKLFYVYYNYEGHPQNIRLE